MPAKATLNLVSCRIRAAHPVLLCGLSEKQSEVLSVWHECHLDSIFIAWTYSHDSSIRIWIPSLHSSEALHETHYDIASLCRDKDMRRANPRATAERHKFPHGPDVLPALRAESFGVLAPDVGVAMHQVAVAMGDVAFLDEYRGLSIGAAANRESGVSEGYADHLDGIGVQAVSYHYPLAVSHLYGFIVVYFRSAPNLDISFLSTARRSKGRSRGM